MATHSAGCSSWSPSWVCRTEVSWGCCRPAEPPAPTYYKGILAHLPYTLACVPPATEALPGACSPVC